MDNKEIIAPTPEVQHLPTIFRRISNGDIRLPAFQRGFVWLESQVIELLESVYKGYPIGSVLLWRVEKPVFQIEAEKTNPFPVLDERYPISFILDGMQRLSTLYGVFHYDFETTPDMFNVIFDLRDRVFLHYDSENLPDTYLHLSALSSPKKLLDAQRRFLDKSDSEKLLDESVKLQTIFQEYLLPTVTISGRNIEEVVDIFKRINSTGTSLGAVDFMRALTWSTEFDLNEQIRSMQETVQQDGFELDDETLVKVLAVVLGRAPIAADMMTLKTCDASELRKAVSRSKEVLKLSIAFLKEEFCILSGDFIPYEGQLLALTKLFIVNDNPDATIRSAFRSWFWNTSFSEALRGKPDHYVARTLNAVTRLAAGQVSALDSRSALTAEDLIDRRFIKGKALSAAVASMFAVRNARSLISGDIIDPDLFMREFSAENYDVFYPLPIMREIINPRMTSARSLANMVLLAESDRKVFKSLSTDGIIKYVRDTFRDESEAVLESQFISSSAGDAAMKGFPKTFIRERAVEMYRFAKDLSGRKS
ncbi:MAG: DUF262 domain-containing protein [Syntrophobacteraceae bacterium]|jgi:hypothetical protein